MCLIVITACGDSGGSSGNGESVQTFTIKLDANSINLPKESVDWKYDIFSDGVPPHYFHLNKPLSKFIIEMLGMTPVGGTPNAYLGVSGGMGGSMELRIYSLPTDGLLYTLNIQCYPSYSDCFGPGYYESIIQFAPLWIKEFPERSFSAYLDIPITPIIE